MPFFRFPRRFNNWLLNSLTALFYISLSSGFLPSLFPSFCFAIWRASTNFFRLTSNLNNFTMLIMPTILIQSGFRFMINTDDHEPMHVHVIYQGRSVLIEFENEVKVRRNRGISDRNIRRILRITEENQTYFQAKWREIYG